MGTSLVVLVLIFVKIGELVALNENWTLECSILHQQWAMNADSHCIPLGIH